MEIYAEYYSNSSESHKNIEKEREKK